MKRSTIIPLEIVAVMLTNMLTQMYGCISVCRLIPCNDSKEEYNNGKDKIVERYLKKIEALTSLPILSIGNCAKRN